MAIGPESRDQVPGRLVVIVTMYAAVGILAVVIGLGPIVVESTERSTVVLGAAALAFGVVLLICSVGLLTSSTWWRRYGLVGASLVTVIGLAVIVLAVESVTADQRGSLTALVTLGLLGLAVAALGVASLATVARMPAAARRRKRRRQ